MPAAGDVQQGHRAVADVHELLRRAQRVPPLLPIGARRQLRPGHAQL